MICRTLIPCCRAKSVVNSFTKPLGDFTTHEHRLFMLYLMPGIPIRDLVLAKNRLEEFNIFTMIESIKAVEGICFKA